MIFAFPFWGKVAPQSRMRGWVCPDCPIMGCIGTLAPHQSASRTASLSGEAFFVA